jgi:hypothetical protein
MIADFVAEPRAGMIRNPHGASLPVAHKLL